VLESIQPIRDQLKDIVRDAWDFADANRVVIGRPRGEENELPIATIQLTSVARDMTGLHIVTERMEFEIAGEWLLEDGEVLEDLKLDKAADLGEAILDFDWNSLGGYLPQVGAVTFGDDDFESGSYALSLSFSVLTDVEQ
jgi:hypothetical protein